MQRKASQCVTAASRSIGANQLLPWNEQFEVAALEQRVMLAAHPFISGAQSNVEGTTYTLSLTANADSGTSIDRWDFDTNNDTVADYTVSGNPTSASIPLPAGVSKVTVRAWAVHERQARDDRYEASSTKLDNTFSSDGKATVDVGSGDDGESVVVQADGKIIVVGRIDYSGTNGDFAIARLNVDGTLDNTFSGDGKLTVDFGGNDMGYAAANQADGKILVVGRTSAGPTGSDLNVAMLRLNTDGSLDSSFNADGDSDGKIISNWGSWEYGEAVAVLPNGKFVVGANRSQNLAVAQYTSSGALDTANFNPSGGVPGVAFTNGLVAIGVALAVHPTNGSILVTGYTAASGATNEDFAMARFTAAGVLDATFDGPSGNGNGVFSIDYQGGYERGQSVVIQSDDKILIGGVHGPVGGASDYTILRLSSTGALDNTFSGDGIVTRDNGSSSHDLVVSLALQPDGVGGQRIVVGGYTSTGNFSVLRYDSAGTPDNTLDYDGLINTDFGAFENCTDMVLTPNGEAVAAGWTGATWQTGGDFAVARYIIDTNVRLTPAAPTTLTATAVSSSQINLAWTDNSAIESGYKIERSADGGTTWSLLITTAANAITYNDTTVTDGASYLYRLKGTNTVGDSSAATSSAAITPLIAPTGLTATVISATEVDLAWTDNTTHETGYKIERSTNAGSTWTVIQTTAASVTAFADTTVTDGTDYRYRVTAINAVANSAPSAMQSATTPLAAPSALAAIAGSSSQINLTWTDNSSNESRFDVQRSTSAAGPWADLTTAAANATSYAASGLSEGTRYYFQIRAHNAIVDSAWVGTVDALTLPNTPTQLTATSETNGSIYITWTDNSQTETGFIIEHATDGVTYEAIDEVSAGSYGYTDSALTDNTLNYYRVRAIIGSLSSPATAAASATAVAVAPGVPIVDFADGAASIDWDDPSLNEAGFRIERSTDGISFSSIGSVATDETTFSDGTATPGTPYYYRVVTLYSGSVEAVGAPLEIAIDPLPDAVTEVAATAQSPTTIEVSWTNPSDPLDHLEIDVDGGGQSFTLNADVDEASGYLLEGLDPGTAYTVAVRALTSIGSSEPSSTASATTPLPAPSDLVAAAASSTQVNLSWTEQISDEDGFLIERRQGASGTFVEVATVDENALHFADGGLVADTDYQYRIRAFKGTVFSDYTDVVEELTSTSLDYSTTFGGTEGSEWSSHSSYATTEPNDILGKLNNSSATLTLDGIPEGLAMTVAFDLYKFNKWDGAELTVNVDAGDGPQTLDSENPSDGPLPANQDFDGVHDHIFLQEIQCFIDVADSKYHVTLPAVSVAEGELQVEFTGSGFSGNGAWGLDNVSVTVDVPTVTVEATDAQADEESGDAGEFTFTRSGGDTSAPLTVKYLLSGSALPAIDYLSIGDLNSLSDLGEVIIPANQTSVSTIMSVVSDDEPESTEAAVVSLFATSAYTFFAGTSATVLIGDGSPKVTAVTWKTYAPDAAPDGWTPNVSVGAKAGGTVAIFAEKQSPSDAFADERQLVTLEAQITPIAANKNIYFGIWDLHDDNWFHHNYPSAGPGQGEGIWVNTNAIQYLNGVTDAQGIARVTFRVSPYAGNDYIANASTHELDLQEIDQSSIDDRSKPKPGGTARSKILDVWRTLYLERDSMKMPDPKVDLRADGTALLDGSPLPRAGADRKRVKDVDTSFMQKAYLKASLLVDDAALEPTGSLKLNLNRSGKWVENSEEFQAVEPFVNPEFFGIPSAIRDVPSEELFWVVQVYTGYDGPTWNDGPIITAGATGGDDDGFLVFPRGAQRIHSLEANPKPLDVFIRRVAFHESLHAFGILHGTLDGTENIGNENALHENPNYNLVQDDAHNMLSLRQKRWLYSVPHPGYAEK